jgi:UDP-N-acetylglucosamine 2-epimerase
MTIVGTRPEIIKLSRVINQLDDYTDHTLVHTGQNYDYELNGIFFDKMGIRKPDIFLEAVGSTTAETIGNIISKSDVVIEKINPDAIVIYGDTNSCLSVISAKKRKIPIFHLEAGNRCFDQRVPEEVNRKIVDHLSDINLPLTEHARRYLIREGISQETIIKVGSPMQEVIEFNRPQIESSTILQELSLSRDQYFVLSAHREENIDSEENFRDLIKSINALTEIYTKDIILSLHPRTAKKLNSLRANPLSSSVTILKPLAFHDYMMLQKNAFCVISDSGTITEEASILNIAAITIRQAHERPEGMDHGTLIMSGLKAERIIEAIDVVTNQHSRSSENHEIVTDYDTQNFSLKVLRIVLSYIDYVKRTVWYE